MEVLIQKVNNERRIFGAVAYRANAPADTQGDTVSPQELYEAVLGFSGMAGLEHKEEGMPQGTVRIIGSYMTGDKYKATGMSIPANSWFLTGKVAFTSEGDKVWERIKAGLKGKKHTADGLEALTGWSIGGEAIREMMGE